jgi:hypothetical protein
VIPTQEGAAVDWIEEKHGRECCSNRKDVEYLVLLCKFTVSINPED